MHGEEDMEVEKLDVEEMKNVNKADQLVKRTGVSSELEGTELEAVERSPLGIKLNDGLTEGETNDRASVKGEVEINKGPGVGGESVGRTADANEANGINVGSEGKREECKGEGYSAGDASAMDITDVAVTGTSVPDSNPNRGKMSGEAISLFEFDSLMCHYLKTTNVFLM